MKYLHIGLMLLVGFTATAQRSIKVNDRKINTDSLDNEIKTMLDATGVPGMSLAIFNDKKVLYFKTYGYRELDYKTKVDKKTVFEAASLTKSFLVFVAHQLVEEGKLNLDKPMYQYLPEPRLEHDPRYKKITPRMILSHSSGIENWQRFNNPDTLEILSDPGTQFVYSGEGYQYLAKVIEGILHQSYADYIEERVLKPLRLKTAVTHYTKGGTYPKDIAIGYNSFGKSYNKWKNDVPVPASGGHVTARDYANLVINMFNGKYISDTEAHVIYSPVIKIDNTPSYYYGTGYEALYNDGDTIIFHGGSNDGFRSFICYSPVKKCGIVYFTNSDRGSLIAKRMNEITIGLPIAAKFATDPIAQYPSHACDLLKVYNQSGPDEMMVKMKQLEAQNDGKLDDLTFNEIGYMLFSAQMTESAKRVFEEYHRIFPDSPVPYYFLGRIQMDRGQYETAYQNLLKAKELNFNFFPIDWDIENCARQVAAKINIHTKN